MSEKVLSTVPKGIVGGFEFTVLQRNFEKKWHGHGRMFATAKGKGKNVGSTGTVY